MARGKPSHPITHTRRKLDRAFLSADTSADLAALRARMNHELREVRKPKITACGTAAASAEIVPKTELPEYFKARKEVIASLTEEEVISALARVRSLRNIKRGRFSSAYKPRQDTSPENLDPHGDTQRQRVNAPFTLPVEIRNRIELAEAARRDGSHPEPAIRPTRLDHALTESGRYALARYIEDRSIELESRKGDDNALAGWRPAPLTPEKARALDRIDAVHKALCPEDKRDLLDFTRMFLSIDDRQAPTDTEFGSVVIGYLEKTTAEGAYLGVMARLASRLHHILKAQASARETREKAAQSEAG